MFSAGNSNAFVFVYVLPLSVVFNIPFTTVFPKDPKMYILLVTVVL